MPSINRRLTHLSIPKFNKNGKLIDTPYLSFVKNCIKIYHLELFSYEYGKNIILLEWLKKRNVSLFYKFFDNKFKKRININDNITLTKEEGDILISLMLS